MDVGWFIAGVVFLISGTLSLIWVLRHPTSKELPYLSHDLSVKIGAVGSILLGVALIYSAVNA
ncbi:hypothetical protein [Schleiferia thermophila]|jgi:hypothetical protein|uniref:Uncharacterized protein n=1 Tax=Schleiferia thermophila TaxID=884107 RepID=A0A368ZX52_9FLAO|nr:hypothetical protein [Schleiferia thermophila]RCX00417.1 hypothetical protein DES35_1212 [Schleiferia thermophila]GCD80935.1 hypothetical protein JCM30197_21820 [Schleiferia thermophila]